MKRQRWYARAVLPIALLWVAVVADGREQIFLELSSDRSSYAPGGTIRLTAAATDDGGAPAADITKTRIVIKDPGGRPVERGELVSVGAGVFGYDYALPADAAPGSWQIEAKVENAAHVKAEDEIEVVVDAGSPVCMDGDGDGYAAADCGGSDCDDSDPWVHPGATEVCGDGIDQDCSDGDLPCGGGPGDGGPHGELTWAGAETCLECHAAEAREVHGSVMYQWQGEAPDMVSGPRIQGKIAGSVNSYCINIEGNWPGCGSCHVGLGLQPEEMASAEQLANIDCMLCHQQAYRRTRVDGLFVPDTANMAITMDEAARTVHRPVRANCLQCHARAGGGDAVKRGDLSLAHGDTADLHFDVHMSTTGANLHCQQCHITEGHRVAGRGSDLRPTDLAVPVECTNCHADKAQSEGHEGYWINNHVARVACQTCHIPLYGKDAGDSAASEATETHRTWLDTHTTTPPIHPASHKANNLLPEYRFWNHTNRNYLLGEVAEIDPATGRYPTSRPIGGIDDPASKMYPFKYKSAEQPLASRTRQLIALDTSVFFATGDADAAARQGLANMGLSPSEAVAWIETDTFQALNHEVSPASSALDCSSCHGSTARMDLQGELGYQLKADQRTVCTQCHGNESYDSFTWVHDKHVKDKRYDCSWCHEFSRPERGLRMPGASSESEDNTGAPDETDEVGTTPTRSPGRRAG
jgi:mono/diheme cytochrome c family protein